MEILAMNLNWADLAFGSKKPVNELRATFIVAPRELSTDRFKELLKQYLPKGNIVLGIAKEPYVEGFDGQPQFIMLDAKTVQPLIDKVNLVSKGPKVHTLSYHQRELKYLFEKLDFAHVVVVNGSCKYTFHTQAPYYVLANNRIPLDMVSPFASEDEARDFEANAMRTIMKSRPFVSGKYREGKMLALANEAATYSFDYSFQTGAVLGKKSGDSYELLAWSYNKVVPFQTYAMHYGNTREINFSPPNDLNHYDAVHAEVEMIVKTGKEHIDLKDTTLFINLLPCPSCARMLVETDISEFVYTEDHSNGYAIKMLEAAGKKVRRVV
jgi:deoxycytidylate deaminase